MRCHPHLAILEDFLFPYGNGLFEGVDGILAGFEGGFAVGSRDGDDNGDLAGVEDAYAVVKSYLFGGPAHLGLLGYLAHFGYRHGLIGFEFQAHHRLAFGLVANGADEYVDAAGAGAGHKVDALLRLERSMEQLYIDHDAEFGELFLYGGQFSLENKIKSIQLVKV